MTRRDELAARAGAVLAALQGQGLVVRGQPPLQSPEQEEPELASSQTAKALARKGVLSVGYNALANEVVVYTSGRLTKAERAKLPEAFADGVNLRVSPSRLPTVDGRPPAPLDNHPGYVERDGRYCCGSSISVGNNREAGSLGCLVRDKEGTLFGLTNNHVVGGCSYARVGLPVVAPGVMDVAAGGRDPFTVGRFARVAPMISGDPQQVDFAVNSDAALVRILGKDLVTSWQGNAYDTPCKIMSVSDMEAADLTSDKLLFEKVGRTTGRTIGAFDSETRGPERVSYKLSAWHSAWEGDDIQMSIAFEGVMRIRGSHGTVFSQPGDSGSLVVARIKESGERFAFGLLFAGVSGGHSYVLPIGPVLDHFGVELVGGLG
ncbi:hypothetical protein [uncultured Enterovirga sp.]|uniref:hypothetical protein n=1 Tax=uncultured Enterovirga sp. TaxID=2026352 RepID=UPI0035C98B8C